MNTILVLVILGFIALVFKIYYKVKLEALRKGKKPLFWKIFFHLYTGGLLLPILKKSNSHDEKKAISGANFAVATFWLIFFAIMIIVAVRSFSK